jgi:hypothetical protein
MGEEFMREMFKPVDANIGSKPVRTPQHPAFDLAMADLPQSVLSNAALRARFAPRDLRPRGSRFPSPRRRSA